MLTLICGHPRAGKTTYSKQFENVIHLDEMHTMQKVREKMRGMDGDVVVEGVYYSPRERVELLNSYRGEGSRCICMDTPKEVREQRMGRTIKHDYPFRIPTYDEGWDEIVIIRSEDG